MTLAVVIFLPLAFGAAVNRWKKSTKLEDYIVGLGFILAIAAVIGFPILIFKSFYEVFFK